MGSQGCPRKHIKEKPMRSRLVKDMIGVSFLILLSGCTGTSEVSSGKVSTPSAETWPPRFYSEYAQPPCNLSRDEQARVFSNIQKQGFYRDEERQDRLILGAACAGRERRQALKLKFRHQYPTMSNEEIEVLVRDAFRSEPSPYADSPPAFAPPPPSQRSCISNRIGDSVYTNCY